MIDPKHRFEQELKSLHRYAPSDGDDLLGMEIDFVAFLGGLDQLDVSTLTVRRTSDPAQLIIAESVAAPGIDVEGAVEAVRQVWLGKLRYSYGEAHYLEVLDRHAVLHFVTQIGPGGFYVTGTVTIAANDR